MNVETVAGDFYADVHFVSMDAGWLTFGDEDVTVCVPTTLVAEVNFTDGDELDRFRKAAVSANGLRVWTS